MTEELFINYALCLVFGMVIGGVIGSLDTRSLAKKVDRLAADLRAAQRKERNAMSFANELWGRYHTQLALWTAKNRRMRNHVKHHGELARQAKALADDVVEHCLQRSHSIDMEPDIYGAAVRLHDRLSSPDEGATYVYTVHPEPAHDLTHGSPNGA